MNSINIKKKSTKSPSNRATTDSNSQKENKRGLSTHTKIKVGYKWRAFHFTPDTGFSPFDFIINKLH